MKSTKITCLLVPLFLMNSLLAYSESKTEQIKPFTSDGCSSFPDGTIKQKKLWLNCCVEHDKSYWMGGTEKQRLQADKELKSCVEKTGEKAIANLMMAGVRFGGSAYLPTSFRWGYGWDFKRGYKKLNDRELEFANKLLKKYENGIK